MKKFMLILATLFVFFPLSVMAETQVKNLKETVESIDLSFNASDYKETSDQVTVYLFRMTTCEHCHDAIAWLNEVAPEYGSKFKLRSFEITSNQDNNAMYKRIVNHLEIKEGVPLMIVGDQYFRGFSETTKEKILAAIDEVYESKDTYDIFEEIEENTVDDEVQDSKKEKTSSSWTAILFSGLAIAVVVVIVLFIIKK